MLQKALLVGLSALAVGCASADLAKRQPDWQPRVEDLGRAQARVATRLEEVVQNLQLLKDRLDVQEADVKALKDAQREQQTRQEVPPPMPVIRVESLPAATTAEEASPAAQVSVPEAAREVVDTPATKREGAAAAAEVASAASDLYRKAYNSFRDGRFGAAILDFEEFLRLYPENEYADNALYWIGESYYSQGEYAEALTQFSRVVEKYPKEPKAPDAMVKMGLSYGQLGDPQAAKGVWRRLVAAYPDSAAAAQARELLSSTP